MRRAERIIQVVLSYLSITDCDRSKAEHWALMDRAGPPEINSTRNNRALSTRGNLELRITRTLRHTTTDGLLGCYEVVAPDITRM